MLVLVSWPVPEDPVRERAPIRVELLGPALVEAWGEKVSSGLRASAYELLAWYALHPDGATAEAAIDALWPDAPAQRGRERFWTALGNLRSRLHGPGEDGVEILAKVGEHYRPDPSVLDIDLWRFEAALTDAARAERSGLSSSPHWNVRPSPMGETSIRAQTPSGSSRHARISTAEPWTSSSDWPSPRRRWPVPTPQLPPWNGQSSWTRSARTPTAGSLLLQAQLGRDDAAQRAWRLLLGRLAELDLEPEGRPRPNSSMTS